MDSTPETPELTARRAAFVDHYVQSLNGTKAAIAAGYSPAGARVEAYRLLTNANIRAAINERMKGVGMGADEAIKRTSNIAAASITDYVVVRPVQGHLMRKVKISDLVAEKEADLEFIKEYMNREGLYSEEQQKPYLERMSQLRLELLDYLLKGEAFGEEAELLVPGAPVVTQQAELDLVALAQADGAVVKKYKLKDGVVEVELSDPAAALDRLHRIHGSYERDNEQQAPKIMPEIRVYTGAPPLASSEKDIAE